MGRFEQEFKEYQNYDDRECYRKSVPAGMAESLAQVFATVCGADSDASTVDSLRNVANALFVMAGVKATDNWQASALRTDIKSAYHMLCAGRFAKFMDATLNAAERLYKGRDAGGRTDLLRELNDVFARANFGYTLRSVDTTDRLAWEGRFDAAAGIEALSAAAAALKDISHEALEHIEQAKGHLTTSDKSRSRKDAVRDAMSALEAMTKKLANESEFDRATKKLRDEGVWGSDTIVKDGHSTWNFLHKHHPDIRHGHATGSDIDLEEAIYWIDRITTFVKYMAARKRVLGR